MGSACRMRHDGCVSQPSRSSAAVAGVLAGAAGVAVSQGFVWAADGGASPLVAVASVVRDATPGPIGHWLVELVGHWDKRLLIIGTAIVLLGLCALAGRLSLRHLMGADLVFVGLAGLGLAALLVQEHRTTVGLLAVPLGLVTWIVVLRALTPSSTPGPEPEARRAFLVRAGVVAAISAAAVGGGYLLGGGRRKVEKARRLLRLPVTRGTVPPDAHPQLRGMPPFRTPNARFYRIDTLLSAPAISPHDWTLRIHGMVERELVVTYEELISRKLTEDWVTICCVSNPVGGDLIGNAWWSGVPLRDLLGQAGVQDGADAVLQTSQDGWNCATPLEALTDDRNAILAVAMNGQPLPVRHGFPVRTIVPGLYGYVSATKWVVDLEVTRFDKVEAYWTQRGWSEQGPVKTQSRIDVPRSGSTVPAGQVGIGGVAWAQHRGIEKVEFQVDGGPWQEASLGGVPNLDTWVQWTGSADLDAGDHVVVVRATDKQGRTQTSVPADVLPDGATGWDSIEFSVERA